MSCVIFYCWLTDYHKLNSLKQHDLLSHTFCGSGIQHNLSGFSVQGLKQLKSRCWLGLLPHLSLRAFSKLIQVVCSVGFLVLVGLRSLFPCWLSTGGYSLPHGPLHCQACSVHQMLMFPISDFCVIDI